MMKRTIRPASSSEDMESLARKNADLFEDEFGFDDEYRVLVKDLYQKFIGNVDDREALWLVECESGLMGSIGISRESEDVARLRLLFVHPCARKRGIGHSLMERALAFAREKGYHSIILMTEDILEDAGRLYRRFGFHLKESEERSMWGRTFQLQTYEKKLV